MSVKILIYTCVIRKSILFGKKENHEVFHLYRLENFMDIILKESFCTDTSSKEMSPPEAVRKINFMSPDFRKLIKKCLRPPT